PPPRLRRRLRLPRELLIDEIRRRALCCLLVLDGALAPVLGIGSALEKLGAEISGEVRRSVRAVRIDLELDDTGVVRMMMVLAHAVVDRVGRLVHVFARMSLSLEGREREVLEVVHNGDRRACMYARTSRLGTGPPSRGLRCARLTHDSPRPSRLQGSVPLGA